MKAQTTRRSNWGRWGEDDQRGALNLLTEERILQALARPRLGKAFALGTSVGKRGPISGPRNPTWHVTTQVWNPDDEGRGRAEDMLMMHTHAHSHLDGLAHIWVDDMLYNGVPSSAVSRAGTKHASVEHYGPIIGTAALIDLSGRRPLAEGDVITADDLEDAARDAGTDVAAADIILIRTGWMDLYGAHPKRYSKAEPGLGADANEWIAERDPAVIGMDNFGIEPIPAPAGVNPLLCHEFFLRDLGVPLIENLDLSAPASEGISEGLFITVPLKIEKGLGSPVNPILVV